MARLSQENVDRLVEWRGEGRTMSWIAERLGITTSGVYYHGLKAGLPVPGRKATRNGFTPREDEILTRMRIEGASTAEIAAFLGLPKSSVYMRLHILALDD